MMYGNLLLTPWINGAAQSTVRVLKYMNKGMPGTCDSQLELVPKKSSVSVVAQAEAEYNPAWPSGYVLQWLG